MSKAFFEIIIIIPIIVKFILTSNINKKLISGESSITIKIEYNDSQQVLSKGYKGEKPTNVKIGDCDQHLQNNNDFSFKYPNNTIEIIWENNLYSTENMFEGCSNITEIYLSNFNSSLVNNTKNMFYGCSSLITLDISNFNLSRIGEVKEILSEFYNLEYLNLINTSMKDYLFLDFIKIFFAEPIICEEQYGVSNTGINCSLYNNENHKTLIFNKTNIQRNKSNINDINIIYKYEYQTDCLSQCPTDTFYLSEKIIFDVNTLQQTEYGKCLNECPKGYVTDEENGEIKKCKHENLNIFYCTNSNHNSKLYNLKCNNNESLDNAINFVSNIECYNTPFLFYLSESDLSLTKCYKTCRICDQKGNETHHNCIECNSDFPKQIKTGIYVNCFCSNYHYFDNEIEKYICTNDLTCPNKYKKLIEEKSECINDCQKDFIYRYQFRNNCYDKCPNNTKISDEKDFYCEIICNEKFPFEIIETQECIKNCDIISLFEKTCRLNYKPSYKTLSNLIIDEIINGSLDEELEKMIQKNNSYNLNITQGNDLHYISSLLNMMKQIDISSVDFKGCENILKGEYLFNDLENIIMYKIEHNVTGLKIPILEYVLFLRKNNSTIKLNLDLCEDISIIYYIPLLINDSDIIQHDPGSSFYNDECNKYTSEAGTDVSLYDRKNNFNFNNMSLCEKSCEFLRYDFNKSRVECECKIKVNLTFWNNDTDFNDLLAKIEARKSITNFGLITCDVFSSKENIESNPGFYTFIFIIIVFIIVFIIFCVKGYNSLKEKIDEVIYKKFDKENKNKKNRIIKESKKIKQPENILRNERNIRKNKRNISKKSSSSSYMKSNNSRGILENKNKNNRENKQTSLIEQGLNKNNDKSKNSDSSNKPETDYEFNWLSYKDALKYDKRKSSEYYCSLIQGKQLFIFTFCSLNDYNSGVMKKLIFFLSFALHYPINALFFTDKVMHKIYEDEGKYNFSFQIPYILYSAIISTVILRLILQFLVLTDKDVLEIKLQKTKEKAVDMKQKKLKCIIIKFTIFFILMFILLGFFWYYLTCFNAIYINTQICLIENTCISFAFSLIYPFIINLLPMIFRIKAIHSSKKDQGYLYKISQIIQII